MYVMFTVTDGAEVFPRKALRHGFGRIRNHFGTLLINRRPPTNHLFHRIWELLIHKLQVAFSVFLI